MCVGRFKVYGFREGVKFWGCWEYLEGVLKGFGSRFSFWGKFLWYFGFFILRGVFLVE